jgi:hypothetical protein
MRVTDRGGRFKTETDFQVTGPEARKTTSFAPSGVNFEMVRRKKPDSIRTI